MRTLTVLLTFTKASCTPVNINEVTESSTRSWVTHVAYMEKTRTVGTPGGRKPLEELDVVGAVIKTELKEVIW